MRVRIGIALNAINGPDVPIASIPSLNELDLDGQESECGYLEIKAAS